jgi:hypothetical protein
MKEENREMSEKDTLEMWAIVDLMGHARTAGIIRTSDLGGLLRIDVPVDDGYRTEYYGEAAIYSVKVVSEEIARAYALPEREIVAWNEPIVPRKQYEEALKLARNANDTLRRQIRVLEDRLVAVNALPAPADGEEIEKAPF